MTAILDSLQRLFKPTQKIPAGIYSYTSPQDDPRNYRLHLRIEDNGDAVLIINASTILHLNQTAAEYAYYLIQSTPADEVARKMSTRYRVDPKQAKADYQQLTSRIQTLIDTPDLDPVTFLDFDRKIPFSGQITAPYRLDCALTYRVMQETLDEVAPNEEVERELSTQEWIQIMDKAWKAGIPHIIFTGGEPTLRDDLPELLAYAETLGMVTGILTDGIRFADDPYREVLLNTGLDHVMIILNTESEKAWEAVEESIVEDVFIAIHLTITKLNQERISEIMHKLVDLGVHEISISASDPTFKSELESARNQIAEFGLNLVWNLPVPYSVQHPVALEMQNLEIVPEGAGRAWFYVEPDGDVRAMQGAKAVLGNLLTDDWKSIWQNSQTAAIK